MRKEVQAQLVQNRVDLERCHEETRQTVEKIAVGLEELTSQLNAYKPASAENVGDVQKIFSEQVAQKLSVQEQIMDLMSHSLEEQKKAVTDSTGLLRDLMIGIENLGDNMKNIQKEMDYWRNPEAQEAEEEFAELNEHLWKEVPLFVPAEKGPENVSLSAPDNLSQFPAQRQHLLPMGGLQGIPASLPPKNLQKGLQSVR